MIVIKTEKFKVIGISDGDIGVIVKWVTLDKKGEIIKEYSNMFSTERFDSGDWKRDLFFVFNEISERKDRVFNDDCVGKVFDKNNINSFCEIKVKKKWEKEGRIL